MRDKILFVHGFNSGSDSETGAQVQKYFGDEYDVEIPDFDMLNPTETLSRISKAARDKNCKYIIGHSLGGFYVLATETDVHRIVINPCFYPTKEIPKLDGDIPQETIETWQKLESFMYDSIDPETKEFTTGIFGTADPLFSYKDEFASIFGEDSFITVPGGHKLTYNQMEEALDFVKYPHKLNGSDKPISFEGDEDEILYESVKLTERYHTIFTKSGNAKDADFIRQYGKEIFNILQAGYEKLGGMKGCNGYSDLVKDSDIWKVKTANGVIKAVVIYTTKRGGRKVQYASCVPDAEGKACLYAIIKEDIEQKEREAWGEFSDALEHKYLQFGASPIPINLVRKAMHDKTLYSDEDLHDIENLDGPVVKTEAKDIEGNGYRYIRKLGVRELDEIDPKTGKKKTVPEYHQKIALGNFPKNLPPREIKESVLFEKVLKENS